MVPASLSWSLPHGAFCPWTRVWWCAPCLVPAGGAGRGCWASSAMNVLSSGAALHILSKAASEDIWVLDTAGWDAPVLGPCPPSSSVRVCPCLAAKAASPPAQNNGTSSPDPFESQPLTVASSKPSGARKTPESFLGPNAALVNLDSLVTRPAPPAQALNPFLAPGMWLPGFPQSSTLLESGPGAGLWALTSPPTVGGLFPQAIGRWGACSGAPAPSASAGASRGPPEGLAYSPSSQLKPPSRSCPWLGAPSQGDPLASTSLGQCWGPGEPGLAAPVPGECT